MAQDPSLMVFRRYAKLNIENLLYLQETLSSQEEQLNSLILSASRPECPPDAVHTQEIAQLKQALSDTLQKYSRHSPLSD
jgi:hypothetical protein